MPCQCRELLDATEPNLRVKNLAQAFPFCQCENNTVSNHSPGPVSGTERLARFIFSPIHIGEKGIKPSLFSHVETRGCSIQRESFASKTDLGKFVTNFLTVDSKRNWHGVVVSSCNAIREIRLSSGPSDQAVCVYDTGNVDNNAHAEMFWSFLDTNDGDRNELRALLMEAFKAHEIITPQDYLDGSVFALVSHTTT